MFTSDNVFPSNLAAGQGNGLLGAAQEVGGVGGRAIASADFDSDGDDDAVVGVPASCMGCADAGVVFYRNDAGALVDEDLVAIGGLEPLSIAVGDLTGDDVPDLAFGHQDLTVSSVTVLVRAP